MCNIKNPCKDGCPNCSIEINSEKIMLLSDKELSLVEDLVVEIAEKKLRKLIAKAKKLQENRDSV